MFLDDSITDAQSQSVISDFHAQTISDARRSNPDFAVSAFLDYCIHGIIDNVEKNLLKLVNVSRSDGKTRFEFPMDADTVELHVVFSKDERVFENLIQIHRFSFWLMLACKTEQALHNVMCALRLLVQLFDIVRPS